MWVRRFEINMRRNGGRLVLEADEAPDFSELRRPRIELRGEGDGTLRLRLGRGVQIGSGVTIEVWACGSNVLEIGDHCHLHGCVLQLRSGSVSLADHVQIRDFSVVKSSGDLRLGSRAIVSYSSEVHCESAVVIEDLVGMAERVTVVDSDKELRGGDDYFNDRPSRVDAVRIGRNTYIGAGVVITRGARIGRNCAIAANAVVNGGEYPGGLLLGGVPARQIRELPEHG